MQKLIAIRPVSIEKRRQIETKRQARLQAKARMKANGKLSTTQHETVDIATAHEIDPVEFARAFQPFREAMELLAEEDQAHFQNLLRGYLAGNFDHETWRRAVGALRELRQAHTPPLPKNYWKRSDYSDDF